MDSGTIRAKFGIDRRITAEIAAIVDAFGLQVASHGGGPTNMHMLCAMPNALYMETSGPQRNMVNSEIPAPEEPGMGSEPRRRT